MTNRRLQETGLQLLQLGNFIGTKTPACILPSIEHATVGARGIDENLIEGIIEPKIGGILRHLGKLGLMQIEQVETIQVFTNQLQFLLRDIAGERLADASAIEKGGQFAPGCTAQVEEFHILALRHAQ